MDIGLALGFVFEDEEWVKKVLIAAVLVLTGIGGIAVTGWSVEIIRRLVNGDQEVLPGWDNIGKYFLDGLKLGVVFFIWSLPIILVGACVGGLIPLATDQFANSDSISIVQTVVISCVSLLAIVYSLILALLAPAAFGRSAEDLPFGQLLKPGPAFKLLRANFGGFLVAWILANIAFGILATVGTIVCVVGIFPAVAYGYAFAGHLLGQAYVKAKENAALLG
jgi:hypothetical protein